MVYFDRHFCKEQQKKTCQNKNPRLQGAVFLTAFKAGHWQGQSWPSLIAQLPSTLLLTRERVLVLLQASTIRCLILELLVADVLLDGRLVEADRAHVVPLRPEVPRPVVVLQVRVLVEDHQARLAFQVPHEARHRELRGYPYKHVYVVRHRVGLDYLDPFVHAAPPDVLPDVGPQRREDRLPPVFRREHDVVLAVPLRVRKAGDFVVLPWHNVCAVLSSGRWQLDVATIAR